MNKNELQVCGYLTFIFCLRIFGLMMILPVAALYVSSYNNFNYASLGLVVGSYGFAQALLQLPLGFLSDRVGRRPVIVAGLCLLALGSLIAYMATDVYGLILGRTIQGAGAIGSTILACVADNSSHEKRTLVMAILGGFIGLSFFLSILIGPAFTSVFGFSNIFLLTFVLACIGAVVAFFVLPSEEKSSNTIVKEGLFKIVNDVNLIRVYFGIWALHTLYTALFIQLPLVLVDKIKININQHWSFYAIALLLSLSIAIPAIITVDKKNKYRDYSILALLGFLGAFSMMFFGATVYSNLVLAVALFFAGFSFFESILPSLASKFAPTGCRGSVMGLFSSCQFFGVFSGGLLSGLAQYFYPEHGAAMLFFIITSCWALLFLNLRAPNLIERSYLLAINDDELLLRLIDKIKNIYGVAAVFFAKDERKLYVKITASDDAEIKIEQEISFCING
ncbi:MAG: MFS transporter [Legionellales bacterium]|jgi:MFS family permease|nr:MFS transporter [Legionellales bacterium]